MKNTKHDGSGDYEKEEFVCYLSEDIYKRRN